MKSIAYSSPFIPAEWIAAHGLRPVWLSPKASPDGSSMAVTRGLCPYVGSVIDAACSGIDVAALALTTVCDQMRYAATVIQSRGACPVFLMNVPSTWQTPQARQLYCGELRRFGAFLVNLGGKAPDEARLAEVMLQYDRRRSAIVESRAKLSARQFAAALSGLRGDAVLEEERIPHTPRVGLRLPSSLHQDGLQPSYAASGSPLAILGGPLLAPDYELFDVVEQHGGRIVLDATEGGERTLPRSFDAHRVASDPMQELADAYFDSIPDAFRRPDTRLYQWLKAELAVRQARGIIFRRYVWCDLWHAELQRLRQSIGLPILEIDAIWEQPGGSNRLEGRIEAFLEMLRETTKAGRVSKSSCEP